MICCGYIFDVAVVVFLHSILLPSMTANVSLDTIVIAVHGNCWAIPIMSSK